MKIGIGGKMRSGKDTVTEILIKYFSDNGYKGLVLMGLHKKFYKEINVLNTTEKLTLY